VKRSKVRGKAAAAQRVEGGGFPAQRRRPPASVWAFLLLVVVTVAVYANSLQNEFLFDDLQTIVEQKRAGGEGELAQLMSLVRSGVAYRPIRSASYAFDYAISGLDPWGYHLSNIAYHTLSVILVFLIARTLFTRITTALLMAALFAVHPIQTEAVTYLSGRRDVLSGLFVLAGLWAFIRYRSTGQPGLLALAVLCYPLAFFSKESGFVLPLLCFGYDVLDRVRARGLQGARSSVLAIWDGVRAACREAPLLYLSFAILAAGLMAYVLFVVRGTWVRSYYGGSLWFTGLTMARVFLHYIKLLIFPLSLNADYSFNAFPVTTSWTDAEAWVAVLVLMGIGYGLLACLRSRPLVTLGGTWFFVALLPVSQVIPHHEMMAEHFLYIPSVGFSLAIAAVIDPLLDRPQYAPALYALGCATLLLLSLRTVWRNADWKDDLTLWSQTVQVAPQSARARTNLGGAYLRRGQLTLAQEQLEAALQIKSDLAVARGNLGKIYLDRGDLSRAEQELQAALRLKEDEVIPRLWLGVVYGRKGQVAEAEQQFRIVLSRPPYDVYAYSNLGVLSAKGGRVAEAESAFREALRRMPELAEARENLARLDQVRGARGVQVDQKGAP